MLNVRFQNLALAVFSAGILTLSSCNTDSWQDPVQPSGTTVTRVAMPNTEAGGVYEETFTASANVTAIDKENRRVTLTSANGRSFVYTAGPQIRNFDQIRVGDKVTATFSERLVIFVGKDGEPPTVTHRAELERAPKGAKPGAMSSETYEVIAMVKSINLAEHSATLEFPDGPTITVPVRAEVDLTRYHTGDSVVIRVTSTLAVVVTAP